MRIRASDLRSWLEQGRVPAVAGLQAARIAALLPSPADWRAFADRALLWIGSLFLAFAVIFFIAYNWQALGRFAKFGLAEGALILAVIATWRLGLESLAGRAALFAVALLVGALLALVGQTYQTGADTFELFAAWALAILPLTLLAAMPALWLLWLALVNLAVILYFLTFQGMLFGFLFGRNDSWTWALFVLNAVALVLWEAAAVRFQWPRVQWARRCVAFASGAAAAVLGLFGAVDDRVSLMSLLAWSAWTAGAYFWYRHRRPDLFVLAGGVLGAIVVFTAWLSRALIHGRGDEGPIFLVIGMLVIALSAAGSYWLRNVARELNA